MTNLGLNFLDDEYSKNGISFKNLLEKYGIEICRYADKFFTYAVTSSQTDGQVLDVSLYIQLKDYDYAYRILTIELVNIEKVKLSLLDLDGNPQMHGAIQIIEGLEKLDNDIVQYLSSNYANNNLRLLINRVNLYRETNTA